MRYNAGTVDRVIRIALGGLLVALVFFGPKSAWVGVAGVVLLMTGFAGYCPLYGLFGLRTSRARS